MNWLSEMLEGEAKGKFEGERDADGQKLAVVHVTIKIKSAKDITEMVSEQMKKGKTPPGVESMSFDWILAEKPEHARTKTWDTPYRVFLGGGAAFEPGKQLRRKDFTRSSAYAILVVEAAESVPWPKPDELVYDPAKPLPKLGGLFPDGFYAVFVDGSVRFIKNGTDEKTIRAWITRGGEKVELPPRVDRAALAKAAGVPFGIE